MSKYSLLPFGCLVFLLTILGRSFSDPIGFVAEFLIIIGALAIFRQQKAILLLIALLSASLAFLRFHQALEKLPQQIQSNRVEFDGYIRAQEIRPNGKQRLTVKVISSGSSLTDEVIQVYAARYPDFQKGKNVHFSCILETPEPFDGFAYDRYLASQGILYLCQEAWGDVLAGDVLWFQSPFEWGRLWISHTVSNLWAKPVSSLVLGLLLGTRESFPQQTLTDFQRAGVTHIIALSGFNISVLIVFVEGALIRVLLPKRLRLWVIVVGIISFTVFVGAGASITRAAIMGALALIAKYSARRSSILRVMLLTATIMTLLNPFVLAYDLGFQLSFLSTMGLLYLTPLFSTLFRWMPNLFALRESLATTMAATIGTLPLILYQFGQLSTVSPIANMMILPLIPWLMAAGGLAVVLAAISTLFSLPFIIVVEIGCQYLLNVSAFMASFSWASFSVVIPRWGFILSCCAIVLAMYYVQKHKELFA